MLSHDLERMAMAGWLVQILPSEDGIYRVKINVGGNEYLGESAFSIVQAIEKAEASLSSVINPQE